MAKRLIFKLLIISCSASLNICTAQSEFYVSLEPNLMLANREIKSGDNSGNYLSSKNAIGIGLNLGYRKDLGNNFYIAGALQVLNLRNSVGVNLALSGFDSITQSNHRQQNYSMSYINAVGLALSAEHKFDLRPNKYIRIGLGCHVNTGVRKPGAGALVSSTKNIGSANAIPIYQEEFTASGSDIILAGLDLKADYVLKLKRRSFFIGLHYALNPGGKIKGNYTTFPYFLFSHSGTFEIATSYLGLNLGIGLSK